MTHDKCPELWGSHDRNNEITTRKKHTNSLSTMALIMAITTHSKAVT